LAQTIADNRDALVTANNNVRDAQVALNKAIVEGQEDIKQLGFDAEDAALSEKEASLKLDDARAALAAVQDLPPNNKARQEAELAYEEADLNLRKATDASQQLNAQQAQLAKTGVAGTQVVIDATQALADAQTAKAKAVVDALQSQQDATDNLAKAQANAADAAQPSASAGSGGTDPFAGLNQAQIDFVNFIQSLKPQFEALKAIAANSFLPPLQEAITTLSTKAFDTVANGVGLLGTAMGKASISLANAITTTGNLGKLNAVFINSAPLIETAGKVIGNLYGIILSVLVQAAPAAQRFANYLTTVTTNFDNFLSNASNQKGIQDFFLRSSDALATFGDIFGNIFKGFAGIINANLGPGTGGGYLLTYIDNATGKFADLDDGLKKQTGLKNYFNGVDGNLVSILGFLGELIKAFGALGTNPAIGKAFDTLKQAVPFMKDLADKSTDAAPNMAQLIVTIAKILDKLADTGAIKDFFDTLNDIGGVIYDVLNNKVVNAILTVTGRIHGVILAFVLLGTGVGLVAKIILGHFINIVTGLGQITGAFDLTAIGEDGLSVQTNILALAFGKLKGVIDKNPLGAILVVIGLVVAALVFFYNNSKTFHDAVNGLLQNLGDIFGKVFGEIQAVITPLLPVFQKIFGSIVALVMPLIADLVGAFGNLTNQASPMGKELSSAFGSIGQTFAQVLPPLLKAIEGIIGALAPLVPVLLDAFSQILKAVLPLIPVLISALVPAIEAILKAVAPLIGTLLTAFVPVLGAILKAVGPLIDLLAKALIPIFDEIIKAVVPLITLLLNALIPIITTLVNAFAPLIEQIAKALVPIITLLIQALTPVINLLVAILVPAIQVLVVILQVVITVLTDVVTFIINVVVAAIQLIVDSVINFQKNWQTVFQAISDFFSDIWNGIVAFFQNAIGLLVAGFQLEGKIISDVWTNLWNGVTDVINAVGSFIGNIVNGIVNAFKGFINFLPQIGTAFGTVWQGILDNVKGVINSIIGAIEGLINHVLDGVNGLLGAINTVLSGIKVASGGAINLHINPVGHVSLPRLANGGVVLPSAGGSIVNVAEAGKPERIEPLDANGLSKRDKAMIDYMSGGAGGGVQITVQPSPGMNETELANKVGRILAFQMRKGGTGL
jgi:phage-related protein